MQIPPEDRICRKAFGRKREGHGRAKHSIHFEIQCLGWTDETAAVQFSRIAIRDIYTPKPAEV
jgi:hypothetical protein